jgi:hypothetical protein
MLRFSSGEFALFQQLCHHAMGSPGGGGEMQTKRVLVVALAVVCAGCLAWVGSALFVGSTAVAEGTGTQRWEYLVVDIAKTTITLASGLAAVFAPSKAGNWGFDAEQQYVEIKLDVAGAQGWELVTVIGVIGGDKEYVFKRPLP